MSLVVKSKTEDSVNCEVVDGGELKSRRHLNVRGKSATLPSITEKDWDDIKFGVDNKVDFYVVSFVKDAAVVHELKNYFKSCGADIHVIPKIESADFIPNLHSIIAASDGVWGPERMQSGHGHVPWKHLQTISGNHDRTIFSVHWSRYWIICFGMNFILFN
ncbi:hypothetical protein POM88_032389 [Heracleum sosnowskyi]|uniref:Pyruvate kinase n=1 Tax=Heracleum sosnowskyi TaxID=360622 RepID=A0AAD8I0F5_9APIA|nr:hypothetical protein POM88_032389 [Heracleum sosnowskyi]